MGRVQVVSCASTRGDRTSSSKGGTRSEVEYIVGMRNGISPVHCLAAEVTTVRIKKSVVRRSQQVRAYSNLLSKVSETRND